MNSATLLRDISACVKDIQETHGLILRRIDEIDIGLHECTWYSCNKHSASLIGNTVQRILMLENKEIETNQEISHVDHCVEKMHEWIKNLELKKGDLVVNFDKNIILDETWNDSTHTLPIDTILTNEDAGINQLSICQEDKHETPDESDEIQVFYNDFQQENDVPNKVADTVQTNAYVGLDLNSNCNETGALMDQPDVSQLNPRSISIETNLKTKNFTHHEEKQYLDNIHIWNTRAKDEIRAARESGLLASVAMHTVVCVDTSASMLHNSGRSQVIAFVNDFLNGLKELAVKTNSPDDIALVTFGNETHVAKRLTFDYKSVMHVLEDIKFGGPSPMYGGLTMAIAAAESAECFAANVNGNTINTQIVLITDGKPTHSRMVKGPDAVDNQISEDTQYRVLRKVSELAARSYLNLYVVPVGDANLQFLELIVGTANGKMLRYDKGKQFSRRKYLTILAAPLGTLISPLSESSDIAYTLPVYLTEQDKDQIKDLREEGKQSSTGNLGNMLKSVSNDDYYHESTDKTLPQVGSRVVRGPDWIQNDQDGGGPGTIIGHSSDMTGMIRVEWDRNANINIYRYSAELGYDVLLIDKPREIIDERIKRIYVGCVVKPGKHFNYKGTNVNRQDIGVVIKVLTSAEDRVLVRWNNFKRVRGEYSYGCQGFYEVELCQTDKQEHEIASVDNHSKGGKTNSINNKNRLIDNRQGK